MQREQSVWLISIRSGLIAGAVSLLLCLVGMVMAFSERYIISGIFTMGQLLYIAPPLISGYLLVRRIHGLPLQSIALGAVSGFFSAAVLVCLVLAGLRINFREVLVQASPDLYSLLTFHLGPLTGSLALLGFGAAVGAIGAAVFLIPNRSRSALTSAITWVVLVGLLRELLITFLRNLGLKAGDFAWFFGQGGLSWAGASIIGALVFVWSLMSGAARKWAVRVLLIVSALAVLAGWLPTTIGNTWLSSRVLYLGLTLAFSVWAGFWGSQAWIRRANFLFLSALLLLLPDLAGIFVSDVLDNVGIFILMGLGLNIVVGFAGLLDLGYVAFYAIGAYTMGVLTSPELGGTLSYWQALPIALFVCVLSGAMLGLPVLKMRGDYLAIVTLGFGEIVRLLVLSDWLEPWLGGTQGIQHIANPKVGPVDFGSQQMLFYVIVVFILIAMFIAVRLKDSHVGRSWMALREDEDVAKAMGINHVTTKLLAFASGAFFAGLGGTLFAAKLSSAYPQSFQFLVSINVLSLIIVGGMGSIPGVIVGGLALVGLPDLLREFAEYRYLVYGAVLVGMMLMRPEGLRPEARRALELHEAEEEGELPASAGPAAQVSGGRR